MFSVEIFSANVLVFYWIYLLLKQSHNSVKRNWQMPRRRPDYEQSLTFLRDSKASGPRGGARTFFSREETRRFRPCVAFPRGRQFSRALAWVTRFTIPKENKELLVIYGGGVVGYSSTRLISKCHELRMHSTIHVVSSFAFFFSYRLLDAP